jgi:hypothetical protein
MENDDFYPFMKVSLSNEYGVVTDTFFMANESKCYGVILWDTDEGIELEDWRGLYGTFEQLGGHEIDQGYQFKFINDNGTSKGNT